MRGGALFVFVCKLLALLILGGVSFGLTGQESHASDDLIPFQKEVNLTAGVSQSGGTGLQARTTSALGFVYFRAFTPPQAGRFVLRMLADTLVTGVKSSTQPLLGLETNTSASALLIRFGFSGCYLPNAVSMLCMDDGPRIAWFQSGDTSRHVLGSFPLGLSAHLSVWPNYPLHFRAEFGQWNFVNRRFKNNSFMNLYWLGAGYAW